MDYPTVAHTAAINGFIDKIYDHLPECANQCFEEDTDITLCPYFGPGCLCITSIWGGEITECIAENGQGNEVSTATSLVSSVCSGAGVPNPDWYIPASASAGLLQAAAAITGATTSSTATETTEPASLVSSVAATNSDRRHTNATSTNTNNSVTTATFCSSSTDNLQFNQIKWFSCH